MNISILGTGWLGLPLAEKLEEEHNIKGSVTSQEKMQQLREAGITPYQIKIFREGVQGDLTSFLAHSQILIIDIPPGLRDNPKADFIGKIDRIITYLEKSQVEKVIFVSSTSVFKDQESFPEYTEDIQPNGSSQAARQIISSEEMLLGNDHFQTSVIRFGGLIGQDRHPVTLLANKTGIKNPNAPVNLIHQQDCIAIIDQLIKKDIWNRVFNAVFPDHPSKKKYYTKTAKERKLQPPKFDQLEISKGKTIRSLYLKDILGFTFTMPL